MRKGLAGDLCVGGAHFSLLCTCPQVTVKTPRNPDFGVTKKFQWVEEYSGMESTNEKDRLYRNRQFNSYQTNKIHSTSLLTDGIKGKTTIWHSRHPQNFKFWYYHVQENVGKWLVLCWWAMNSTATLEGNPVTPGKFDSRCLSLGDSCPQRQKDMDRSSCETVCTSEKNLTFTHRAHGWLQWDWLTECYIVYSLKWA